MRNLRESRRNLQICRLCMGYENLKEGVTGGLMYCIIRECLQMEIDPDDENLPTLICSRCAKSVRKFHRFRRECWKVQRLLISKLRHRDFLEIVNVANISLPVCEDYALDRRTTSTFRAKKEMMVEIREVETRSIESHPPRLQMVDNKNVATTIRSKASNVESKDTHSTTSSTFQTKARKEMMVEIREVATRSSESHPLRLQRPEHKVAAATIHSEASNIEAKGTKAITSGTFQTKTRKETLVKIREVENHSNENRPLRLQRPEHKVVATTHRPKASNVNAKDTNSIKNVAIKTITDEQQVPVMDHKSGNSSTETLHSQVASLEPIVDSLEPEFSELEMLEGEFSEQHTCERVSLKAACIQSDALDPGTLESEVLDSECLELVEPLEPDAAEPKTNIEPESVKPEASKSSEIAVKTDVIDKDSHLKPHDYTNKRPWGNLADSPKMRPKPRRRANNISGKALYKSLLMPCDTCGKMIERNRLEGHHNKHLGLRPYICSNELCNSAFHCKHARRLHVRCRHGDETFSCDLCGKVYRARRDLLGHKREAHAEPKFECDICDKKFTTRSRLKQHRFYHTGERNHPCSFCTMTFFNNFQLKVHLRTHTQARPFVCKVCKKAFRYRHMAKDHIVRQHGIDEAVEKDWIINHPEPEVSELLSLANANLEKKTQK